MIVLAARQFWLSTALATRAWPKASPPLTADAFDPNLLGGQDIIYICAHGMAGGNILWGDNFTPMLSDNQIREARLAGALVWLGGCWGLGSISDAFLAAGAAAVVADQDVNWAGPLWPTGSNRLGQLWLAGVRRGRTAKGALDEAIETYAARHRGPRDDELLASVRLVGDEDARVRMVA